MGPCDEYEIQISAYVDGAFEGPEAQRLEAHLRGCVACATSVERERRLHSALRAASPLRAPERLRARVGAAVREIGRASCRERVSFLV